MIKVFWAEDKATIRESVKNTIEWGKEGIEFVGEAVDGELALPLIQKEKPDILVTDIKMPFMNGLELSRYIKKKLPDIKIIILSEDKDFAYAQEAIRIGVVEYLIKPVSKNEFLEAIKKVAELVRAERRKKDSRQKFERNQEENERIERMKFFEKMVSGKCAVSELLENGREIGIELVAKKYNIVLFQIFANGEAENYEEQKNEVRRMLKEIAQRNQELVLIEGEMEKWIFLLKEVGEKNLETIEAELSEKLYEILRGYPNIEYLSGVGKSVERLSRLNKCFEEANYSFAYRYLGPHDPSVHEREVYQKNNGMQELELSSIKVDKLDRKAIETFLKTGLKSEVTSFIEEYFVSVGRENMNSCIFRQYVVLDMCFAATSVVEQMGYDGKELVERCGNMDVAAASFSGIKETKVFLEKLFGEVVEIRDVAAGNRYRLLLQDAKAYIQQNFSNEEISLNAVAASINLSPNHFSTIFRQEAGQTFIEYLTSVRMEKARELLRGTAMKTSDIAQAVGYKDSHYFSYLFKKMHECTPREFRNGA